MTKKRPGKKKTKIGRELSSKRFANKLWEFIEKVNDDRDELRQILSEMSEIDFIIYMREFYDAAYAITNYFDKVGYTNGEPSEDGKEDLFFYVVAQGRDYFDQLLAHPESLPSGDLDYRSAFMEVPTSLFYDRFGKNLYDEMYHNFMQGKHT